MLLVSKIMKILKAEGGVALETHVEDPHSSAIFAEYPRLLKDHALTHLITDSVRLLVVSSSPPRPDSIEDVMNLSIKTHHHDALVPAENLVGKAQIVLLSWHPKASIFKPWTWVLDARPSRFFKILK